MSINLYGHVDPSKISRLLSLQTEAMKATTIGSRSGKRVEISAPCQDSACGIVSGLKLPDTDVFDMSVNLLLTRKQTNEAKELFKDRNRYRLIPSNTAFDYLPQCSKKSIPMKPYELSFRIVRFKISANTYETVVTNLDSDLFSPFELKDIYAMRWGIETSFRDLKYTVGFLHFHAKKWSTFSRKSSPV